MAIDRKADSHRAIVEACRQELLALEDLHLPVHWERAVRDDWALNRAVALGFFVRKHR